MALDLPAPGAPVLGHSVLHVRVRRRFAATAGHLSREVENLSGFQQLRRGLKGQAQPPNRPIPRRECALLDNAAFGKEPCVRKTRGYSCWSTTSGAIVAALIAGKAVASSAALPSTAIVAR